MIYVASFYTGSWAAAIAGAVAAADGPVVFPRNTTISLSGTVILPSNTTLLIPADCTIIKMSSVNSSLFELVAPTFPDYTENVHIIGGEWRWDTVADPGVNDERGFIRFKYGRGCSIRGGVFQGANASWPAWSASVATLEHCIDSHIRRSTANETWKGASILALSTPDNAARECSGCTVRGLTYTRASTPTSYGSFGVRVQGNVNHLVSGVVVEGNSISGASINEFKEASGGTFRGNVVENCMMGFSATGSAFTTVVGNTIQTSPGIVDLSVELTGSPDSRAIGNDLSHLVRQGVGVGVYAGVGLSSDRSRVHGNVVSGSADGIQMIGGANHCQASHNSISDCEHGLKTGPATGVGAEGDTVGNVAAWNTVEGCDYGVTIKRRPDGDQARNLRLLGNRIVGALAGHLFEGGVPDGLYASGNRRT